MSDAGAVTISGLADGAYTWMILHKLGCVDLILNPTAEVVTTPHARQNSSAEESHGEADIEYARKEI